MAVVLFMLFKNNWLFLIVTQLVILTVIFNPKLVEGYDSSLLIYREDWREIPAATPVTQEHISHPNLSLHLYGLAKQCLKKSHHPELINDPYYVWSGKCLNNWAVTFKHRQFLINLTGVSKIRWRTKQSGFRRLHIILKLEDGTWLVSEQSEKSSKDWKVSEFNLIDIQWHKLNIETITESWKLSSVDLSRVDEIGFSDLMKGGLTAASSRIDWIEVYGKPVKRSTS